MHQRRRPGDHRARLALPRTLWDAAQRLKASKAARELFGDDFVEHYAAGLTAGAVKG